MKLKNILLKSLLVFTVAASISSLFSFKTGKDDGKSKKTTYNLKFKVNGLKDSACYLANYYGDKQYIQDTARMDSKGNFTFEGTKELSGGIYLVVLPGKKYFEIILTEN